MTETEATRERLAVAYCQGCLFFETLSGRAGAGRGLCRQQAPHVISWDEQVLGGNQIPIALWPVVHEEDWCGEFIRRSQIGEETDGKDLEAASSIEAEKAS